MESPANGVIIILTLNCDDADDDAKQNSKTGSEEERLQMGDDDVDGFTEGFSCCVVEILANIKSVKIEP